MLRALSQVMHHKFWLSSDSPGGWCAVAMEYIINAVPITHSYLLLDYGNHWATDLQDLMDKFHSNGFVHGDLRDVNLICRGDSVMLIDFDWGGKDGEASYPVPNLNEELLEGRSSNDLKIRKEDGREDNLKDPAILRKRV